MPAGLHDLVDVLPMLGVEPVDLEQLPEAEDRVEWGAQLVAHAREELGLRLVRTVGFVAGGEQTRRRAP